MKSSADIIKKIKDIISIKGTCIVAIDGKSFKVMVK